MLVLTSALCYIADLALLQPFAITQLRLITFIVLIAAVVQFTELMIKYISPELFKLLGIFLPLITTNCIVLGIAIINVTTGYSFLEALIFTLGAGCGFALVLVIFAAMRERMARSNVPAPFRGNPIALIAAGLLSLAFMGFVNLISQ